MRCKDPRITASTLDRVIEDYAQHFSRLTHYGVHVRWWIARYSRGDSLEELRQAFALVAEKVEATGKLKRAEYGADYRLFAYAPGFIGLFRDGLVLLSLGLCLRSPAKQINQVLGCCQRGDPLIEMIAQAAMPSKRVNPVAPAFPEEFDGLYAALGAPPGQRPKIIADYLALWLDKRMEGFGFKISDQKIGYWCFEAAGVVAALGVDEGSFIDHPHYPADLAAFHRGNSGRSA